MKSNIRYYLLISLLSASLISSLRSQEQLGMDIEGIVEEGQFGASVSLSSDGSRIAIGGPGNNDHPGVVEVYEYRDGFWQQLGNDFLGTGSGDRIGIKVSLSVQGDLLAVASSFYDTSRGRVQVFRWQNDAWQQVGMDILGESGSDGAGRGMSLSGDGSRVAVGSPNNNENAFKAGQVRVFEWRDTSWMMLGKKLYGGLENDQFGYEVSLSHDGSILATGAPNYGSEGDRRGYVRLYEWRDTQWVDLGQKIEGEAPDDYSGHAISLSRDGQRIAIGAETNDGDSYSKGHVRVFEWKDTSWVQLGEDIDGELRLDYFGSSVTLSADGNRLAAGAPLNDENNIFSGHVRVFDYTNGEWVQFGETIVGQDSASRCGSSVALSADASRLAAGAPSHGENAERAGQVRVFDFSMVSNEVVVTGPLVIYPNPTTGKIHFSRLIPDRLLLMDIRGKLVWEGVPVDGNFDISYLPEGMYFMQVNIDEHWISKKIIKQ